ncbi:radical SAM protein [Candidatus Woesearchaeota archaeon]|nr:radical SAM protein [Candidatus Woesearchaeota archaeon]
MVKVTKKYLFVNSYIAHQNICESVLDLPYASLKLGNWLLKQGNFVRLIDCHFHKYDNALLEVQLRNLVKENYVPDEVWFSVNFGYYWKYVRDEIKIVKKVFPDTKVVVGGIYPTLSPEHAKQTGADEISVGNIEEAKWEWTNHDILDYKSEYDVIMTSRGCMNRCTYCASHVLSEHFEVRDIIDVVDEIEYKVKHNKITDFRFIDDNVLYNFDNHLGKILSEIKARGLEITFSFLHSSDYRLYTEDVVKKLIDCGYDKERLLISYESSNREYLKEFNRRPSDVNDFIEVVRRLKKDFSQIIVFLFLGFRNQNLNDLYKDIILFNSLNVTIMFSPFSPIPKTKEYERFKPIIDYKKLDLSELEPMKFKIYNDDEAKTYQEIKKMFHDKLVSLSDLFMIHSKNKIITNIQNILMESTLGLWKTYYMVNDLVDLKRNARLFDEFLFSYDFSSDTKVLEIGCGVGTLTQKLIKTFENISCLDLHRSEVFDNFTENINFNECNFFDYQSSKKYNVIFDTGVFNSTIQSSLYVKKIQSLLDVGGKISLFVIHKNSFFTEPKNISSNVLFVYRSYAEVIKLFTESGFRLVSEKRKDNSSEILFEKFADFEPKPVAIRKMDFDLICNKFKFKSPNEISQKVESAFKNNEVMFLSTSQNNFPYVRPMKFMYESGFLFAYTSKSSDKVKQIIENGNVSLAIGQDAFGIRVIAYCRVGIIQNSFIKSYFWDKFYDSVFKDGTVNPDLVLLLFDVQKVDLFEGLQKKTFLPSRF